MPSLIALLLDSGDDGLERMSPVASGLVIGVVDVATSNISSHWVTLNGSVSLGNLAKFGELGSDRLPGGNSLLNSIGSLEGDFGKLGVGKG